MKKDGGEAILNANGMLLKWASSLEHEESYSQLGREIILATTWGTMPSY
jgi:hypothetical protein